MLADLHLFDLRHVFFSYPNSENRIIRDVSLQIKETEFLVITGESGSGKTSLLKLICGLIPKCTGGNINGNIQYKNQPISSYKEAEIRSHIVFSSQEPESNILFEGIFEELSFAPANLGIPEREIRRRVFEVITLLGIEHLMSRNAFSLSSGEKQKIALGSLLTLIPSVLCLDEPTAKLSPINSQMLVNNLVSLNRDHAYTIIIAEHNWPMFMSYVDRIAFIENGTIRFVGEPSSYLDFLFEHNTNSLPDLWRNLQKNTARKPLSIKEMRSIYTNNKDDFNNLNLHKSLNQNETSTETTKNNKIINEEHSIEAQNITVVYKNNISDSAKNHTLPALQNFSMSFTPGSITCILGENGAGKTTLLKIISGSLQADKGYIVINGMRISNIKPHIRNEWISYHSEVSARCFLTQTVESELSLINDINKLPDYTSQLANYLNLKNIMTHHPQELSACQRHILSLILAISKVSGILLLDEPTRNCSMSLKRIIASTLLDYTACTKSVIIATHDIEFASLVANTVCILHKGELVDCGNPSDILRGNLYFSSAYNRTTYE